MRLQPLVGDEMAAHVRAPRAVRCRRWPHGTITGGLSSNGGEDLLIAGTTIGRWVLINSMIGRVSIEQAQVAGAVSLRNNITGDSPIVVAATRIRGLLSCTQNTPAATKQARINTVYGPESGQCFNL